MIRILRKRDILSAMRVRFFRFLFLLTFVSALSSAAAQTMRSRDQIGPIPESRVYDHDNVYRSNPEILARMSQHLKKLKEEHDFDAYLAVHSGIIGTNVGELANHYREAWIDEKSDALVFVMDIQATVGGTVGISRDLYEGKFMEEGIMPRMLLTEVDALVTEASQEMAKEGDVRSGIRGEVSERVEIFIREVSERIGERLELEQKQTPIKDDAKFMGIMAIGLLLVGLLIAIASKILGRSDKRAARLYRFPDVLVGERLGAPNGGGKVSFTDFGAPSGR